MAEPDHNKVAKAAKEIVTYIPTEVVAVYVAGVAVLHSATTTSRAAEWGLLIAVLVLTPFAVWATYAAQVRAGNRPLPMAPRTWPWPAIVVSTFAFLVWSYSLPASPFGYLSWYQPIVASIVLLLGTVILGLIAPLLPKPAAA